MTSKKKPRNAKPPKRPAPTGSKSRETKPKGARAGKPSKPTPISRPVKARPKPKPQKKTPGARQKPPASVPPRKSPKTPRKPAKNTTKRPKKPTGKRPTPSTWKPPVAPVKVTNGRSRASILAEIQALKAQLAAERAKKRKPPKKKPGKKRKPRKPRKSKQERGFDLLERCIREGLHPKDQDEDSGEEYYKLIARLTDETESEIYSTLLGSPKSLGEAA